MTKGKSSSSLEIDLSDAVENDDLDTFKTIVISADADLHLSRPVWKRPHEAPLHLAVTLNKLKFVKFMLDSGFDVNSIMNRGSGFCDTALHLAVSNRNKEMVRLLLSKGADPNKRVRWPSWSPTSLELAVHKTYLDIMTIFKQESIEHLVKNS